MFDFCCFAVTFMPYEFIQSQLRLSDGQTEDRHPPSEVSSEICLETNFCHVVFPMHPQLTLTMYRSATVLRDVGVLINDSQQQLTWWAMTNEDRYFCRCQYFRILTGILYLIEFTDKTPFLLRKECNRLSTSV